MDRQQTRLVPPNPDLIISKDSAMKAARQQDPYNESDSELPIELIHLLDPNQPVQLPAWRDGMTITSRQLDQLINRLGKKGGTWRRCLVLFEWLKGFPSSSSLLDARLCTTLIRVCSDHQEAITALSIYDWLRAPSSAGGAGLQTTTLFPYEAAMKAALKARMLSRALEIWSDVERDGLVPDDRIAVLHIETCSRLKLVDRALLCYERRRSSSIASNSSSPPSVHVYVAAMRAASEGGRWQRSLEIWDRMTSDAVVPTAHAYSSAISACATGGLWKRASSLFAAMVSDGIKPDVVSCTALLTSLASSGDAERAEAIIEWMLKSSILPNERTYVALLVALARGGKCGRAVEVFYKMQLPEWGAVQPNAFVYSSLLKSLGEQGKWRLAEAVFRQEEERTLRILDAEAKIERGREREAERERERSASSKVTSSQGTPSSPPPSVLGVTSAYASDLLARSLSLLGSSDRERETDEEASAGKALLSLPLLTLSPSTLFPPASPELTERPSRLFVEQPIRMSPLPDPPTDLEPSLPPAPTPSPRPRPSCINEVVLGALMLAYERSGMWYETVQVLSRAKRLRITPNTIMFNTAISAAGKAGQLKLVEKLLNAVMIPDAVTFETAIAAYGQCGRPVEAEMWFDRLLKAGHRPKDYAFCGLIAAYSLSGDIDKALEVKARMKNMKGGKEKGSQKPCPPSVHVYNTLLAACERAGRAEEALRLVSEMKKVKMKPNALTQRIVESVGKKGVERVESEQATLTNITLALAAAAGVAISRGIF